MTPRLNKSERKGKADGLLTAQRANIGEKTRNSSSPETKANQSKGGMYVIVFLQAAVEPTFYCVTGFFALDGAKSVLPVARSLAPPGRT